MTQGLHLIELAAVTERQHRIDLNARTPVARPGRLRRRVGGLLVGLGERIAGVRTTAFVAHDHL